MLHHLTLWVPSLERASGPWRWLLGELGFRPDVADRDSVLVFRGAGFAVVLEESADMVPGMLHSRLRPGLNHLAFRLPAEVPLADLVAAATEHGWSVLEASGHPIAGGAEVAYLEDRDGFEVELVAQPVG